MTMLQTKDDLELIAMRLKDYSFETAEYGFECDQSWVNYRNKRFKLEASIELLERVIRRLKSEEVSHTETDT